MSSRSANLLGLLCLGLMLSAAPRTFSQSHSTEGLASPYSARTWQTDDDPFRNAVQAVAQTADGYLWIGTVNGLARFDGMQFEFFPLGGQTTIRSQRVNALCATEDGTLWIGMTQGLYAFRDGKFVAYEVPVRAPEMVAASKNILALIRGGDGALWIGTGVGLVHYLDGTFSLIGNRNAPALSMEQYPAVQTVRSLDGGKDDDTWVGAGDSLVLMRGLGIVTNYTFAAFKPDFIRAVCHARDGTIWVGSNSGLIRFKDGKAKLFTTVHGLPDKTISAIHEDNRGNLWIGTFNGLCRFTNGKFIVEMSSDGEPYDQVACFFEDHENNLWVGAKDGLHQLNVRQFMTYTMRHGLTHNNVLSVYEDKEGAMWIGTWGGLHCLRDGKMTVYSTENTPVMRNDFILAIEGARDGGVWFGADYDGGLYRVKNGEVKRYGEEVGILRNAIRTLLEDDEGRLWLGRASGYVNYFRDGQLKSFGRAQGLPSNAMRCLLQTRDKKIWVGTEAGLCCWTNEGFSTFTTANGLSDNLIHSLYEDEERNIWIGTTKGLNRYKDGRFTAYQTSDGLCDNAVLDVLDDDLGNLWMASHYGVFRVSKQQIADYDGRKIGSISCQAFGKFDGMRSQVCVAVAKPSAWKSRDGRLWFATTKGLAVTDPKLQITKNVRPPPVMLQSVMADKKVVSAVADGTKPFPPPVLEASTHLFIPPGRGELQFQYTALSYAAPEKNRFKYRLEGFESDWVDAGTRHSAFYNSIPPGAYTFHVIASNNDGVWNQTGASVKVTLQPHFWQMLWFRSLFVVASLSCAAAGARYVTKKRMQRKLRRLEEQHMIERERSRIAQDIHDEIGAKLTRISFLGGIAKRKLPPDNQAEGHIDRMSKTARELIAALDEIVWAVNPKNDTLDNFADYLCRYASDFFESTPMSLQLEVPTSIPHHPLTADIRHNLFLAQKEALHNVLKHSGATKVQVQMSIRDREFEVTVVDNGRGIAVQQPMPDARIKRGGNGLGNMRERLETIGGRMTIHGSPETGTKISFVVPLKPPQGR